MSEEITDINEWRRKYPVLQNRQTRKWGWRHFNGTWCATYCTHPDAIRAAYERDLEFSRIQRGATNAVAGCGTAGLTLVPRGPIDSTPWVDQSANVCKPR